DRAARQDFYNGDTNTIPSYGVCLLNGSQSAGNETVKFPKVKRPDTFGSQWSAIVNDAAPVAYQKWGKAQQTEVMIAAYDSSDGTPVPGENWGVRSGDYLL